MFLFALMYERECQRERAKERERENASVRVRESHPAKVKPEKRHATPRTGGL